MTWSEQRGATPADSVEHVLLLSLPFGALDRPSLGLGLIQALCNQSKISCDTEYLTFPFVQAAGRQDYQWVTAELAYTAFAGEWLFAEALYGPVPGADARYIEDVLCSQWHLTDADVARLLRIRGQVEPFLEQCVHRLPRAEHTFVGFTSVFQQNIASLALAARMKRSRPDVTIAFGGANWEGAMGLALLEQFSFVDLAFSGEADRSLPAVLKARREGGSIDDIPGVLQRPGPDRVVTPAITISDLDEAPVPDFDRYFEQLQTCQGDGPICPTLPVETSRGCWWGVRSHCTFCGLNGSTMTFRSKSPERVLEEFAWLRSRYATRMFGVVDDILDSRYFHSVLPRLAEERLDIEIFWEVKANLSRVQVRQLRDAGAVSVQPGIESLSDHVLALMRKGTTALRNIELLKWCQEYGVRPLWNLLYGFPGETEEDYLETAALILAIWHLQPPNGYGPIRLDRFSPYHEQPSAFGMTNVRPMAPFRHLYPFAGEALDRIAYYFDFEYADGRAADSYARDAVALAIDWTQDPRRGTLTIGAAADGACHIVDTRFGAAAPRWTVLTGWEAAVYRACDRSQLFATLAALPDVRAEGLRGGELRRFLDRCASQQLMVHSGDRWLAVAVHTPAREGDVEEVGTAGLVELGPPGSSLDPSSRRSRRPERPVVLPRAEPVQPPVEGPLPLLAYRLQ